MARLAVFRNSGRHRANTPYLIDVQSNHLDALSTRVAIPLRRVDRFPAVALPKDLTPVFQIEGIPCLLDVPQLAAISGSELRDKVTSLAHHQSTILGALDRLFGAF